MTQFDDLEKLADLRDKGIISDKDFEAQKNRILNPGETPTTVKKSILEWYLTPWKKYFTFGGRATRSEYWWFILGNFLIGLILGMLPAFLFVAFGAAAFIPGLAVWVRRFHDLNKSAWFAFAPMIVVLLVGLLFVLTPIIGGIGAILGTVLLFVFLIMSIVWTIFLCFIGTSSDNKYGSAVVVEASSKIQRTIVIVVVLVLLLPILGVLIILGIAGYQQAMKRVQNEELAQNATAFSGEVDDSKVTSEMTIETNDPKMREFFQQQGAICSGNTCVLSQSKK